MLLFHLQQTVAVVNQQSAIGNQPASTVRIGRLQPVIFFKSSYLIYFHVKIIHFLFHLNHFLT